MDTVIYPGSMRFVLPIQVSVCDISTAFLFFNFVFYASLACFLSLCLARFLSQNHFLFVSHR